MIKIIFAIFTFLALSCQTTNQSTSNELGTSGSSDLFLTEAQERKERLSDIQYNLILDLSQESDSYSGIEEITFNLKTVNKPLKLEFFEGSVSSIELNSQALPLDVKKNFWLMLPAENLKVGANQLKISYSQKYSFNGQGLHRFKDPVDGRYYLHTQFEAYDANRFMPCFDQPDLKARFLVQVVAPKSWEIITSTLETEKKPLDNKSNRWVFPLSPLMSTYVFSLHAGEYSVFTDQYKNGNQVVPLRIFVRQTKQKDLDPKEWFKITKQGLQFYGKYFNLPYPFGKYDQLIVPELNAGGMENIAAITYTENTIPRSKPTRTQRRGTASVMLHEMAHMWFGDLVTMAWWNDLWLNESFATIMATTSLVNATEFKEDWQGFAANVKRGAYYQDALQTTHPIEAPISHIKEASAIFDGITYNKGASVLKQLRYYMTDKAFEKGIQDYMKTFSYKNASLKDFISTLQKYTSKDLHLWSARWLKQTGIDEVETQWTCNNNQLTEISFKLNPLAGMQFRPQSIEVGLFKGQGKKITVQNKLRVDFVSEKPVILKGHWSCPDFVYANNDDYGYIKVKLDNQSIDYLKTYLVHIDNALVRSLVWNDLWRMVRAEELSISKYAAIVENNIEAENDAIILPLIINSIRAPGSSILAYWPVDTSKHQQARQAFLIKMENLFITKVKASESGSDLEKLWFDNLVGMAETPSALEQIYNWYNAGQVSSQFPLDLDRKWSMVRALMQYNHPQAQMALKKMKSLDSSDVGIKSAMMVESIEPKFEVKKYWMNHLLNSAETKTPISQVNVVAYSFLPPEQNKFKKEFESQFMDYFEKNKSSEDEYRVLPIINALAPFYCDSSTSSSFKAEVLSGARINPLISKALKNRIEEDERCHRIRSTF